MKENGMHKKIIEAVVNITLAALCMSPFVAYFLLAIDMHT